MPKPSIILPGPICEYDNVATELCSCNLCRFFQKINGYPIVKKRPFYSRIDRFDLLFFCYMLFMLYLLIRSF